MKKITFLSISLFLLSLGSHAQCIRTVMNPSTAVVSNNQGQPQSITTEATTNEYSEVSGLHIGTDYLFTCQLGTVSKYITVTDLSNTVIAHGQSPLTVEAITVAQVRLHYAENAACEGTTDSHIVTVTADCSFPVTSFYDNFNTTPNAMLPLCWSDIKSGTVPGAYVMVRNQPGGRAVTLANFTSESGSNLILASPPVSNLNAGTHQVMFQAKHNNAGVSLEVGTVDNTSDGAVFTVKETVALTYDFEVYTVSFTDYTGTDSYVAFRINAGTDVINGTITLDDIRWDAVTACWNVNQITVPATGLTHETATINWANNGSETEWDVVYGPATATDPSTLIPIAPAPSMSPTTTLTGLSSNTSYKVWVRPVCGADNMPWIGPVTFKTTCAPTTSLNETFDTTDPLAECWTVVKNIASQATAGLTGTYFNSPSKCLVIDNSHEAVEASNIMLITPPLSNIAAGTQRLTFYAKSSWHPTTLIVGTIDNITTNGSFTSLQTIPLTINFVKYVIEFTATDITDTYIALRHSSAYSYSSIYIDDIVWEAIPSCPDVFVHTVTDLTSTTAGITWESQGDQTNWQVTYGPVATTDPATLTPTNLLTTTNYSISGLTENTSYAVWVRSVCGTAGNGSWFGPIYFTTRCTPATVPFTEDFESAVVPELPDCGTIQNLTLDISPDWKTSIPNINGFNSTALIHNKNLQTMPEMNLDAWYFTGGINLIGGTQYKISYKYGQFENVLNKWSDMKVMYGTNPYAASMTQLIGDHTFNTSTPQINEVSFIPESTGVYYFGFQNYSLPDSSDLLLDDITIDLDLGTTALIHSEIKFYPSPVKDILTLSYTQGISDIVVYNSIGQKVLENMINAESAEIDMSALAAGSYIVKVTSEKQTKTLKVIKE